MLPIHQVATVNGETIQHLTAVAWWTMKGHLKKPMGTTAPSHLGKRLLLNISLGKGFDGKTNLSFHDV